MIYLPVIVTTLYSLNNGVIKKKLCTAYRDLYRVPEQKSSRAFTELKAKEEVLKTGGGQCHADSEVRREGSNNDHSN